MWRHCRRLDVEHIHVHHLNQASDVTMMAIVIEGTRHTGSPWTWSYTMHGPDEFSDVSLFRLAEKARSAAAVACISDFARSQVMAVLDRSRMGRSCGSCAADWTRRVRAPAPAARTAPTG